MSPLAIPNARRKPHPARSVGRRQDIPELEKKVAKRDALLPKLERAKNILEVKGKVPTCLANPLTGERVEAIPMYAKEINELDKDIGADIDKITAALAERDVCQAKSSGARGFAEEPDIHGLGLRDQLAKQKSRLKTEATKLVQQTLTAPAVVGASALKSLVVGGDEDGAPRNACFVSFNDLGSTNLAR